MYDQCFDFFHYDFSIVCFSFKILFLNLQISFQSKDQSNIYLCFKWFHYLYLTYLCRVYPSMRIISNLIFPPSPLPIFQAIFVDNHKFFSGFLCNCTKNVVLPESVAALLLASLICLPILFLGHTVLIVWVVTLHRTSLPCVPFM